MRNQSAACDPEDVEADELAGGKITRKDDVEIDPAGYTDETGDGDEALALRVPAAPAPAKKSGTAKKAAPAKKSTAKKAAPRKSTAKKATRGKR